MKNKRVSENKYVYYNGSIAGGCKGALIKVCCRVFATGYKILMNLKYPKDYENRVTKYNVAICAIFKNEARYLSEWIEFNRIVGIEHFYLYNNFSMDDFQTVLEPYIAKGLVSLIDWPIKQGQMSAYSDCIEKFGAETKWIGFIDIDEFIVPKKYDSVYTFLSKFEKNCPCVSINWRIFGTSGRMKRDENLTTPENFTVCWDKYCSIGKCFFNTKYELDVSSRKNHAFHHWCWGKYKRLELPPVNVEGYPILKEINFINSDDLPIQINHYFTKSYDEYLEKKVKGDVFFELNPHDEAYFFAHEKRCQKTDFSAFRFVIMLKKELQKKNEK